MLKTLLQIPNDSLEFEKCNALCIPGEKEHEYLTYGETRQLIRNVSDQLTKLVPKLSSKLPVVSVVIPNSLAFIITFLGITWSRCISAPLNSAYTQDEMEFYLQDSEVDLVLVDANGNKAAEEAAAKLKIRVAEIERLENGQFKIRPKGDFIEELVVDTAEEEKGPDVYDVAMFLHTSGTTSRPKRVPLTHRNMCASIANIVQTYEFCRDDRSLLVMPLFHVHGMMAGLLAPLYSGGSVVIHGEKFSASKFWRQITEFKVNWYTAVPTIHQILLARADQDYPKSDPPSLRFIRSCSASLAPSVLESLESKFGAPVLEAYAMTEAAHQMTSNPLPQFGPRKPGSVGMPVNIELAILGNDGTLLEVGKIGEVCIRGENVTSGYVNNEEANRAAFEYGWFHTGDQGYTDSDGYLTLTGRIKELINRGGEKISPLEIDALLLSHPKVSEAVSFGIPDKMYGQVVGAAVVPKDGNTDLTPDEIVSFCTGRLSSFKIPKVFILSSMPRTATGKIQRRVIAEQILKS